MLKRGSCCDNGINPKAVYDFIQRCKNENLGLDCYMLIKDGVVVSEGYNSPYTQDSNHVLYSFSKSITATALGFAIDEGLVNLEDSICKYFPLYDKNGYNKPITIRHLVTMTADKNVPMARNRHHKDWVKIFFDSRYAGKPGSKFMYINDNFYMLSAVISKVTGQTLVDYLEPRLFAPLGIEKPAWETDMYGYAAGGWGLYMKTEDLAKIMLCYSQNGMYDGKQVIPANWVEEATKFQVPTLPKGQCDVTKGYGYGFWQTTLPNTYRAYGLHGQEGYVFKDHNTVLIVFAGLSRDEFQAAAINDMYKTLWDAPEVEYEEKLKDLVANLGDKDDLPKCIRNRKIELDINNKCLKTVSSTFASMLHATITTVMDDARGHIDRFVFHLDDDNNLYMMWKESEFINTVKLGMDNKYEVSEVNIAGITYHAHTKASWTGHNELTVLVRFEETCHVRELVFDFTNLNMIRVKNNSYPDMPNLAAHYLDFAGMPLPKILDDVLVKYAAPAVLLLGEPDFILHMK